jgi:hypothetical protein
MIVDTAAEVARAVGADCAVENLHSRRAIIAVAINGAPVECRLVVTECAAADLYRCRSETVAEVVNAAAAITCG